MAKAEIITIGNELISGKTVDINSSYCAQRLTAVGIDVLRITSVGDDFETVSDVLKKAIKETDFVIITGGLGSTKDDITNEIVSKALNIPLVLNKEALQLIEEKTQKAGIKMNPSLEKMAWIPEKAKILDTEGNACGYKLEHKDVILYFLPGVPEQMRYLLDRFVIPDIVSKTEDLPSVEQRIIKLYGINESLIAEKLKGIKTENVLLGFYPKFPEYHILLTAKGKDKEKIKEEIKEVEEKIKERLSSYIFTTKDERLEDVVGRLLRKKGLTISVAESCTGGLIGHRITNVPGSSDYFMGGAVVYSNEAKMRLLGVKKETLEKYGAVSSQTAKEMAEGIRRCIPADIGLAVTGIAGPSGGTKEKPVGTVFIGLSTEKETITKRYLFFGEREQIKLNTSTMALDWIRRYIKGDPFIPGI